jgi:hypothetical protein
MIERLIENWLTKASEKSFQIPFCYILANEGYTILHLTRHCGMEHGKDIIAIDPSGAPCAFQLKGAPEGKIKLRQWQQELLGQAMQLIFTPVTHPSIPIGAAQHKSFFVTNGELEEEVFNAIDAHNKKYQIAGQPQFFLNTIVKGELIEKAKKLGIGFIPPDLGDFRHLIDFYMDDGTGILDKTKFSQLIESFFSQESKPTERGKLVRGSALLTALATSSYSNKENHVALTEAWTIYTSYLLWFCEVHSIPEKEWKNEFGIANQIIWTSLENLWNEAKEKDHFLVEDYMEDVFVQDYRVTWFTGLFSALGLYYKLTGTNEEEMYRILKFCNKQESKLDLWGESAVPNVLVYYWFYTANEATQKPIRVLLKLIRTIIHKARKWDEIFPEPYYDIDESLALFHEKDKRVIEERNQKGASYYLEGLTHIFVRDNYLQAMKFLWPDISRILFKAFSYKEATDFFRWRNREGKETTKTPNPAQSWKQLKDEARETEGNVIPLYLKKFPYLLPLFLIVFPHRGDPSLLRWLDTCLYKNT